MMPAYDASVQATPSRFDARVSFWSRKAASGSLHATRQSTRPHRMRSLLQQDENLVPAFPRVGWLGGHREGLGRQSRRRDGSRSAVRARRVCLREEAPGAGCEYVEARMAEEVLRRVFQWLNQGRRFRLNPARRPDPGRRGAILTFYKWRRGLRQYG